MGIQDQEITEKYSKIIEENEENEEIMRACYDQGYKDAVCCFNAMAPYVISSKAPVNNQ